jgi:hypothetical protein
MKISAIPAQSDNPQSAALRSLAISEFSSAFPLANFAEFYSIVGNADSPRKVDGSMTAGDTRTLSSDYTAKKNTPGFSAVALKIYGDKVETDIAYERRGIDIGSQRTLDLANFARSLGRYFMNAIINDELSAEKFSGIKETITANSLKTVFGSANGGSLPTGNASADRKLQDAFIEQLMLNISLTRPSAIIMNAYLKARLASIGRSYMSTTQITDIYGNLQTVENFASVPIVDAGFTSNNSGLVIPNNEVEGSSGAACTSLYMVRFGEQSDFTLATNVGLDVKDMGILGTSYTTMAEFDVDTALLDSTALRRISGIIL